MPVEHAAGRFSFSGPWLAIPVGIVLAPAFMLAPSAIGPVALAAAPVAVAGAVTLAIALRVARRTSAASLGALLIGPAFATTLAARGVTGAAVAASIRGGTAPSMPLVVAIALAVVLAAVGARALALDGTKRAVRTVAPALAVVVVVAAVALSLVALVRGDMPSAAERLSQLGPQTVLDVMLDDGAQAARITPHLELRRTCDGNFCELVAHGDGHGLGWRPLSDEVDRALLAIVPLDGVVAVMPFARDHDLDWSRAMAFDTATGHARGVRARDLGAPVGPPRSWRFASWIGVAIAIGALVLSLSTRRARRRIAGATDAIVEPDGTMRLEGGELARAPRDAEPGPVVVLDRASGHATYRREGLATIARAFPGTRASWSERLVDRALGLELAAFGTILLTHAPLLAAWLAGYAVAGR